MHTISTPAAICVLALGLCAVSQSGHAAEAQVGVRTFAWDTPSGVPFIVNTDGSPATGFAVASRSVTAVAGNSSSSAQASADALSGAVREKLDADVAASQYIIGRNAGGSSSASMTGSINLVGPAPPGLATFTASLDGSYDISTPAPFNYPSIDNSVAMFYTFQVGDSPQFNNNNQASYFFCCSPGTFSIPFSWTQLVNAGDSILFDLYLKTDVSAVAGFSHFDASNTFKITGVDLPPGYSFTSDSDGFLSQFGSQTPPASVPEPESALLLGLGLVLMTVTQRRQWTGARRTHVLTRT
jgi:hypothetical protein